MAARQRTSGHIGDNRWSCNHILLGVLICLQIYPTRSERVRSRPGTAFWEIFGKPTWTWPQHGELFGVPKGIRTPVTAVKERGRRPRDDGTQ
jgi:hypothetical protein